MFFNKILYCYIIIKTMFQRNALDINCFTLILLISLCRSQVGNILLNVKEASNRLSVMTKQLSEDAELQNEITWFLKVSWNMGLQCDKDPYRLLQFFSVCFQVSRSNEETVADLGSNRMIHVVI